MISFILVKISPGVQTEVGDKIQHFVLVILPLYCNIYFCGNFGQAKASIAKKKKKKSYQSTCRELKTNVITLNMVLENYYSIYSLYVFY